MKRTRPAVIEPYYRQYQGKPLSQFSGEDLIQKLRSLGIFHTVDVDSVPVASEEVDIRILVEEKWTLIPIPLGGVTGGGKIYGGFMFLESNLFGYNKKMYGGGFLSTKGWKGMLGYIDPRFLEAGNTLFLGFSGGVDDVENTLTDGTAYQRYETVGIAFRSEIQRRVSEGFYLGAGFEFQEQTVNEDFEFAQFNPDPVRIFAPTVSLRYQDLYYDRILVYGLTSGLRYKYKFDFDEYSLAAQYFGRIIPRLRYGLRASGVFAPDTPTIVEPRISERVFRTLPDGVAADSFAGAQAALEFTAADLGWGALTLQTAYEAGVYVRDKADPETTHGPSAGLRIYMSKIAIPAFGFDMTYNVDTEKLYITVNAGMQL